jgi:hypothetical protein
MGVRVVVEVGAKKSFASALDWPGWSRGAKTADDALEALLGHAPRYAEVARRANVTFSPPATARGLEVVERQRGGSGTDFGVPSTPASAEAAVLEGREMRRLLDLLRAAWATFDAAAERARGTPLRLGPRGGGRQVPKIVDHVREAEAAYVHQLGVKVGGGASMGDLRTAFVEAVERIAADGALPEPNRVKKPWSPRYAIRRSAWHALDHAWEIEDRAS